MIRFTLIISDELNAWLVRQAELNHRSKNKHIEHLLTVACKMPMFSNEKRYTLGSRKECAGGHHYFKQADPAMADPCNCGVFIFGEAVR